MKRREMYTTIDVYQTAFLILAGFSPDLVRENQGVIFCFEVSAELIHAISAYQSGGITRANEFATTVEMLKSRVFEVKRKCGTRSEGAVTYGA